MRVDASTAATGVRRTLPRRWPGPVALAVCALVSTLMLAACQAAPVGDWEQLGGVNGSVMLSMAADPFNAKLLYVGTSDGRVLRVRVDARAAFLGTPLPRNDTTVSVLAPDPVHAGTVYAGTNNGLFVSSDFGDTWRARGSGLPRDDPPEALAFGAVAGGSAPLYAGTQQHGAYVSHDGGTTWAAISAGLPATAEIYSLAFDGSTGALLAALTGGAGVWALPAGGERWVARRAGLPPAADVFTVLAVPGAPGSGAALYAGTSAGLFISADHGASWRASGLAGTRVLALAADPAVPGALYAGTDSTVMRAPTGADWGPLAPGIAAHVTALAVLDDAHKHAVVFAGTNAILRYPALPAGSGDAVNSVVEVLVLVVLGATLFYVFRRSRQAMFGSDARHAQSGRPPQGSERPHEPERG